MGFLEIALQCIGRGWHVHPLAPATKRPITPHGKNDATNSEEQVRAWWTKTPDANVSISCGPSELCVLDCDHGLNSEAEFIAWRERNGLPATYTVRTGRRDSFGIQMYYAGPIPDVGGWKLDGCSGQIKSLGGYVCAAGCIHPDSGETYQVLVDAPLAPTPEVVCQLESEKPKTGKAGQPITENRNITLTSIGGKWRNDGMTRECLELALLQHNADYCVPPLEDEEVRRIAANVSRYDIPEPAGEVTFGKTETAKDWRKHYHTFEEMENAPPAAFLIEGFLEQDAITALAAPVGQRKSLIALNVAHALCTGESLFDFFKVTERPTRVLYLCPEMGIRSFTARLRDIKLMGHVGKTLFCRTMSAEGTLELAALTAEEVSGAVVIIDTAVRYLKGDENSSEHMRAFAEDIFRIMREGAVSVLLLHHSAKGTKETPELTLENAMRGSGELGAFVASCWATRLQDPTSPYKSPSYLANVKQRDFESKPFEVTSGPDCRLHIVDEPGDHVKLSSKAVGAPGNADGKQAEALQMIRDNPDLSQAKLSNKLKERGIERSPAWVGKKRLEMKYEDMQAGGKMGKTGHHQEESATPP